MTERGPMCAPDRGKLIIFQFMYSEEEWSAASDEESDGDAE